MIHSTSFEKWGRAYVRTNGRTKICEYSDHIGGRPCGSITENVVKTSTLLPGLVNHMRLQD